MRRAVFLDTTAWLAALSEREAHHDAALDCYERTLQAGTRFVTSNLVLAEMQVLITRHRSPADAVRFLDAVHRDPTHGVVYADRDLEREAIDRWLLPFADHRFSLTDAVSFEVMRRDRLTVALALDRHFRTAGFETVP